QLGDEADRRGDDEHGGDGGGVEGGAGQQGDGGGGEEQEDDDAPEPREQDSPRGAGFGRPERVRPVALKAAPRLGTPEAARGRVEAGERVRGGDGVPGGCGSAGGLRGCVQPMAAPSTMSAIMAPSTYATAAAAAPTSSISRPLRIQLCS